MILNMACANDRRGRSNATGSMSNEFLAGTRAGRQHKRANAALYRKYGCANVPW